MGLPQLETCCFIFDLKTGNIIIGILNAFSSFVMTVIMIVMAAALGEIHSSMEGTVTDPEERAAITGSYAYFIILVLLFLTKFIYDLTFVYGIVMERAGIIKSYMIMWVVFFLLSLFLFFVNITHLNIGHILFELFYISLNIYAILLNYSFYRLLNKREIV